MELFTIALITHQQRHHLERCLKYIFRQDYQAVELIICDDNSCDFYVDEVEAYIQKHKSRRIRSVIVHKQTDYSGKAACCQTALSLSHGIYMMFLSADQELYGRKALSKIAGYFGQAEGSILVTRSLSFWENGVQEGGSCPSDAELEWLEKADPDWLFVQFGTHPLEPEVCAAPVCFRRELLERIGFDTAYPDIPFWPLWLKLCAAGEKIAVMDEVTVHRCIYQVEEDLGYIAFGMKDRHVMDCIRMLREYVLPQLGKMEHASSMDRMRCRHTAAVLGAGMDERKWYAWKFRKKLLWKIKKAPVLCMNCFYRMRTGNFYIDTQKEIRLLVLFSILFSLNLPLGPDGAYSYLWALAACGIFAVLAAKTALRFCSSTVKIVLDKRAGRRKKQS